MPDRIKSLVLYLASWKHFEDAKLMIKSKYHIPSTFQVPEILFGDLNVHRPESEGVVGPTGYHWALNSDDLERQTKILSYLDTHDRCVASTLDSCTSQQHTISYKSTGNYGVVKLSCEASSSLSIVNRISYSASATAFFLRYAMIYVTFRYPLTMESWPSD